MNHVTGSPDLISTTLNQIDCINAMDKKKPIIIFDLDETLVFCASVKPSFMNNKDNNSSSINSFSVEMNEIRIKRRKLFLMLRPGLNELIKEIKKLFEIYFFTAASKKYADLIINIISPDTPITHRFYKNDCEKIGGYLVKNLCKIESNHLSEFQNSHRDSDNDPNFVRSPELNNMVLVDDIFGSALLQPKNLLQISPWFGDKNDKVLTDELLPLLIKVSNEKYLRNSIISEIKTGNFPSISVFHPEK